METLFFDDNCGPEKVVHKNIMFSDLGTGLMVQSNQHIIVHNNEAIILDPGGHKIYSELFAQISQEIPAVQIKHIFLSHQDPDIVAAINGWLMVTEARAYLPALWKRFVTHFGVDKYVDSRIIQLPDTGGTISLGGLTLNIIPAHYLHSSGNFQLYDPVSRLLYTGDLGASLGIDYKIVEDFDAHIAHMESFHQRYMPSTRALKIWVNTIKKLDIQGIVPQHGAVFLKPELVQRFIQWIDNLKVGADLLKDSWEIS
jgi:flavorubredoxin